MMSKIASFCVDQALNLLALHERRNSLKLFTVCYNIQLLIQQKQVAFDMFDVIKHEWKLKMQQQQQP